MRTRPRLAGAMVVACVAFAGCATGPDRTPVPRALVEEAIVPGLPYARFWGDGLPRDFEARLGDITQRVEAARNRIEPEARLAPVTFLALSGGGADGAFGAGILVGWTAAGDRPEFRIVSGISTGALIAPFAFLGSDYDDELQQLYTQIATPDILVRRSILDAVLNDSVASTEPLERLIASNIDESIMSAIALEYYKGRGLLIGTTNLDAGRPVIWSIGAIAASGHPDALDLIRDILRASASIPGAFPPVYVKVEVDGVMYDEMHVDGGTATQVFLYPAALDFRSILEEIGLEGRSRMYVIRNSRLEPEWVEVKPNLVSIANQSISTLIASQGVGDLNRIYLAAQRDGIDYNVAYIPDAFDRRPEDLFDTEYMNDLFDFGYELARDGYPWDKTPPGFLAPDIRDVTR